MFCVYMRVCVCAHTFWLFFTEAPICLMQAGRITILIACGCSGGVNAIHRCVCVVVGNAIASLAGVNGEPGRLGGGGWSTVSGLLVSQPILQPMSRVARGIC